MRQRFNPDGDDAAKSASRRTRLVVIANDDPRAGVPIPTTTSPFSSPPRIISLPARALRASRARSSAPPHASRPLGLDDGGAQDRGALGRRAHARPRGRPGHARRGPAPAAADRPAPPPRLRARLALATLRCKLDAGEEIDACRILLALDVFAAARHLPDADALATTGAHVAAAVIFRRAQNWTEFDDLFREFFVDGAAARAADVRDAVAKARAESAKPAARKKGVSPRPTAGGVTAAYDKIREEYAMDDEELRGAFERMMRRAAEILGADSVSKIADDVASGDYDVASHAAAIRSHEPNERPVDPFATRPSPARKKKGLLRTPTKGKKIASSSPRGEDPRRRPSEEDDARSGGRSVRVQGRRRRRARRRGRRLEPLGEPRRGG